MSRKMSLCLPVAVLAMITSDATALPNVTCTIAKGGCWFDSAGRLPNSPTTSDPGVCCKACQTNVKCVHWQINDIGECHLRSAVSQWNPAGNCSAHDADSPPAPPPPAPPSPPVPPAPPTTPPLGFKPHIVFFMADDYGHYNAGWRGNKEARTPAMDALVSEGIVLDRHYVYQYCSPTRSSFLSGRLPIHVNTENRQATAIGGVHIDMTMISDKMSAAGYYSVQSGKWHAGASCDAALPVSRGFNKSLGYLGGAEDHFNHTDGAYIDTWQDLAPNYDVDGIYNGYLFTNHTLDAINSLPADTPFFLYHAWQECHTPNEVPSNYLNPNIDVPLRQIYDGMVNFMDVHIQIIVDALKSKGMWDKTLIVFSADNGGREDHGFGGNNYPLRGMKFTDFEGGTRVSAWASGGVIPTSMRGTTTNQLIHVCDWYRTFSMLAGYDPVDHKAIANHLPATDSHDVWPILNGTGNSTRTSITLSRQAIIVWPYKVVRGKQQGKGWWVNPVHPNATQNSIKDNNPGCPGDIGCLFNIEEDPSEYTDITAQNPDMSKQLNAMLDAEIKTAFQTNDTPGYSNCTTEEAYAKAHKGYAGPPCTKGNAGTHLPVVSRDLTSDELAMEERVRVLGTDSTK